MNLNMAVKKFLCYADKNGIRRLYEVLPGWLKANYPSVYFATPEFKLLEHLPHKNDRAYRDMSKKDKSKVKASRTRLYNAIAKRALKIRHCYGCGVELTYNLTGSVPCSLRYVRNIRRACSIKCSSNSKETRDKTSATNLAKYGNKCSLNGKDQIKAKKATWRNNLGVSNPSQSPRTVAKILDARYGRKTIDLAGKEFSYQGYENVLLKHLFCLGITANNVSTKAPVIGMFDYEYFGKIFKYLPDIKAKTSSGKIWYFEVKSTYTLCGSQSMQKQLWYKAKSMWDVHKKNFRVVLCSRNEILMKADNLAELTAMIDYAKNKGISFPR